MPDTLPTATADTAVLAVWVRYAAAWSLPAGERSAELETCLTTDVTYCDPHVDLTGQAALAAYMGQFQQSLPGGSFRIESVLQHHARCLTRWTLRSEEDQELQDGASFAVVAPDGRLSRIWGFFPAEEQGADG